MNCIAIDDEPLALEILAEFCSRIPYLHMQKTFTRTSEALKYLDEFPVDLVFLDINMPDVNGVEFYKSLEKAPMVIFTTAHGEYAVEGFNVNAVDFLLKPIEPKRLEQATTKAKDFLDYLRKTDNSPNRFLYVRSEYALVKIPINEIVYIETLDDYIKIHQPGKKPVLTIMSMKAVMEKLPQDEFIRVHRSYIVPINRIESVRGKVISLGTAEVPIGTKYEEAFFKVYMKEGN